MTKQAPPLGVKQYRILRFVSESERPVTQIECHRAVAFYADEASQTTYNAIVRLRERGYVTVRRNVSGKSQSTTVRLTAAGREAVAAEQARMVGAV